MKLGLVTRLDKRDKTMSKKFDDDVTSRDCNTIAIYFNLKQIWSNPEPGFIVCDFSLMITFYLTKNKNRTQNEKISNTTLTLLF